MHSFADQERNAQILADFKQKAEAHGATDFAAVATAVFRKAANGAEFIGRVRNQIGIPVEITSQVTRTHARTHTQTMHRYILYF